MILEAFDTAAQAFDKNDAVVRFANEVLTISEKIVIGRRILVAQMILTGHTYYEVNERLKISPNTFSKVRKWLHQQLPGYESVLTEEKAKAAEKSKTKGSSKKASLDPLSFEALKRKFPIHFMLLNIFDELRK